MRQAASSSSSTLRVAPRAAGRRGRWVGLALIGTLGLGGCASPFLQASIDYGGLLRRGASALSATWPQTAELCRSRTTVDFLRHRLAAELDLVQAAQREPGAALRGQSVKTGKLKKTGARLSDRGRASRDWLGYDAEADSGDIEAARLSLLWRARCEEMDRAAAVLDGAFTAVRAFAQGLQAAAESGTSESGLGGGLVKSPADGSADLAARLDDKAVPEVAALKALPASLATLVALVEPGYTDRRLREVLRKSDAPVAEILGATREYLSALHTDAEEAAKQLRTVAQSAERHLVSATARSSATAGDGREVAAPFVQLRAYVTVVGGLDDDLRATRTTLAQARAAMEKLALTHARLRTATERKDRKGQILELKRFSAALEEAEPVVRALKREP